MKKLGVWVVSLVCLLLVTVSCGKVDADQSENSVKEMPILVEITVDISDVLQDPRLYIRAKDIEIDRMKKEITIKGEAFINNISPTYERNRTYAIKIEGAKFSLPLGGKITIVKDGKIEVLEQY